MFPNPNGSERLWAGTRGREVRLDKETEWLKGLRNGQGCESRSRNDHNGDGRRTGVK